MILLILLINDLHISNVENSLIFIYLKGVFAINEKGYRLTSKNINCVHTISESFNIRS